MGKTSSGKDFVANYLEQEYGIPMVVSYTTRHMRDYETDGVQHHFIDDEKMDYLMDNEKIIAYTKNNKTGIQYCATVESLSKETMVYIINPNGVEWFQVHGAINDVDWHIIYIDCDENIILSRGQSRGDDIETLTKRLESEHDEFNSFRDLKKYDYLIHNNHSVEYLLGQVDIFMESLGYEKVSR